MIDDSLAHVEVISDSFLELFGNAEVCLEKEKLFAGKELRNVEISIAKEHRVYSLYLIQKLIFILELACHLGLISFAVTVLFKVKAKLILK